MTPPCFVLAFANDHDSPDHRLRNLVAERREILQALRPAADAGRCRIVDLPSATAAELFDEFQRSGQRGEIALLHFGGHADSYRLLLESADGAPAGVEAAGLAAFLGHAGGLQLVFLNGCVTRGHVQGLLNAGVPAVISTACAVDDEAARQFAVRFYTGLGEALGLREAFDQAVAAMRATRPGSDGTPRHLYAAAAPADDRIPWELSVREGAERVELWTPGTPPLPPVPRRDLPERPFRHLQRFSGEHAELFFGREREIWELHGRVVSLDAPPVVLLYGQAGVGKSSLLDAGLLPRLEGTWQVRYARRDAALGLAKTLARAVGVDGSGEAGEIAAAWLQTEVEGRQPLLVILDQVEEAFTRTADPQAELTAFARVLGELFRDRGRRPRGKLVLGFRKEWLAEIESALQEAEVPRKSQFLPRLSGEGVIAAITGVERDRRLCEHYGLSIEEGLPERIAADLLRDEDSHLAPLLQILLSAMWDAALERDHSHPRFDGDLYETLTLYRAGQEGKLLLDDFLGQQFAALGASQPAALESGLALDFLAFHTTRYGTARERTAAEGTQEYPHQPDTITKLCEELTDLYLLTGPSADTGGRRDEVGPAATRLAHDTLAPLVRRRFEDSDAPGQRARRVLENRAPDWTGERVGIPLDWTDLAIVEAGEQGMRTWSGDERRLVEASKHHRRQRRHALIFANIVLTAFGSVTAISLVFALAQRRRSEERRMIAESQLLAIQADRLREQQPEMSLLLGVAAYERSPTAEARAAIGTTLTDMSPRVKAILRSGAQTASSSAVTADGHRVATADQDGMVVLWDASTGQPLDTLVPPRSILSPTNLLGVATAFSRDGKWLMTRGERVGLWKAAGDRWEAVDLSVLTRQPEGGSAVAAGFSPDSHTLAVLLDRGARLALRDLRTGSVRWYTPPVRAASLVYSPDGAWLALGRVDGIVTLLDSASMSQVDSLRVGPGGLDGHLTNVVFSPTGRYFAALSPRGLAIYDTAGWTRLGWTQLHRSATLGSGMPTALAFASDSVLVIQRNQGLHLYRGMGRPSEALRVPATGARSLSVDESGTLLASTDSAGMTVVWDLSARRPWRSRPVYQGWTFTALSPTGGSLAVGSDAGVDAWNLDPETYTRASRPLNRFWYSLAFSGNGYRIAFTDSGHVFLWDGTAKRPTSTPVAGSRALALDHDGTRIAVVNSSHVYIYSAGSSVPSDSLPAADVTSLAFAQDGSMLAIGKRTGQVSIWIPSADSSRVLDGGQGAITNVAFDPSGRLLAGGDSEGDIMLWDLDDNDRMESPPPPRDHNVSISALAFSPDGSTLVSGDRRGGVALWDVSSRLLLARSLVGHKADVVGLAFTGHDGVLVSADESGVVERTDVRPAAWVRRACRIANWDAREEEWRRRFPTHGFPNACRRPPAPAGAHSAR